MSKYTLILYVDGIAVFQRTYKRKNIAIREALKVSNRSKIVTVHIVGTDGTFLIAKSNQLIYSIYD